MKDLQFDQQNIVDNGFTIIHDVYTPDELQQITAGLEAIDPANPNFRKTKDLFAIRQFFKEIPAIVPLVFNNNLHTLIGELFGDDYFIVKSIYFDKPGNSNWFVAYHQDLTISVDKKLDLPGYGPWTIKHNQFAVQPLLSILEDNFTIRIHLDDTDADNGALKIIPQSHSKGEYRADTINWDNETEATCTVKAGGIMIMKPLLLHASNRTINGNNRRVIHVEFSRSVLPDGLEWAEKLLIV
ncbi:phytanoyl-CoA dioxygenase family protein [Mucilaginibacter gynuensis]|uniref:Phytanoyl-CoA dioxygenase family protein n=1 Tax=Mucilaginibacter gynuensis TaxID=1302236 RepID=A0ABP8G7S0_9SPHI